MTTLLIGGTGFLGSHVAERLAGSDLVVMARTTGQRAVLQSSVSVRQGDLDDLPSVERALKGVDGVVYCASMGFGHVPPLLTLLESAGVRRAMFVSTTAIFTRLPAPSRAVRLEAERAVGSSALSWTILRPTMIYGGARDRNVARLLHFLKRSPLYPIFGSGQALHQPIFIEDLADAVVQAFRAEETIGKSYNVAGAAPCSYRELVRTAAGALGKQVALVGVPLGLALAAARVAAALPLPAPVTPEQILRLEEDKAFDYSEAVGDFGFRTRSFAEGVKLEAAALGLAPVSAPVVSRGV